MKTVLISGERRAIGRYFRHQDGTRRPLDVRGMAWIRRNDRVQFAFAYFEPATSPDAGSRTTHEPCPQCQTLASCEHGISDTSIPARPRKLHVWNCPECGRHDAIVCYDCPDCP